VITDGPMLMVGEMPPFFRGSAAEGAESIMSEP
jgi:hypothetical protein